MISIRNLNKYFKRGTVNELRAINNVTLEVPSEQFVILLGANGSGKTTLLNLLSGSIFPDDGELIIDGTDVTKYPDYKRSKLVSRIFQNPMAGTASELSIMENFRLASLRTKNKTLKTGINKAFRNTVRDQLETLGLGLENKPDQLIGALSGGQRQAITLLMAVIDESKVLLLDEPASALDPRTAENIMELNNRLIKQHHLTAVLVTHFLKDAINYGSRVIMMKEGRIFKDTLKSNQSPLTLQELNNWYES